MKPAPLVLALCLCSAARAEEARPAPEPRTAWATVGGGLTLMVPLAIGGAIIASSYDIEQRKAASLTISTGLALAPIVSHLAAREWTRAAIFGAIPVACLIGMITLLEIEPTADIYGTKAGRLTYGSMLSFGVLASAIGVMDTLGAARRARERAAPPRARAPLVVPSAVFLPHGGGLAVAGAF